MSTTTKIILIGFIVFVTVLGICRVKKKHDEWIRSYVVDSDSLTKEDFEREMRYHGVLYILKDDKGYFFCRKGRKCYLFERR